MKNLRNTTTGLIVIYCIILISCSSPGLYLKFDMPADKTYTLKVSIDQDITTAVGNRKMNIKQKMIFVYTMLAQKANQKKNTAIKITYNSIFFEQEGPNRKITYDSTKSQQNVSPVFKPFEGLIDKSFFIKCSSQGKVLEVEGMDKIITQLIADIQLPEKFKNAIEKSMRKQFGNEAIKENMAPLFACYPERPLSIGNSWKQTMSLTQIFPATIHTTWTLKDRKNGIATLEIHSDVIPASENTIVSFGLFNFSAKIKGKYDGYLKIKEKTGLAIQGEILQKIYGKITAFQTKKGQPETIPISIKSTINFQLVK